MIGGRGTYYCKNCLHIWYILFNDI
jgi:hypothetical protein